MDAPLAATKSLPLSVQLVSFAAATIGFAGTAFVCVSEYLRSASLDAVLTKDTFYRLNPFGEALFCRVTMLARNGPALIRSVTLQLEKLDGARKTFPLKVEQFGTLVSQQENLFQEHNYYGSSTLHFLAADKPERLVYYTLHDTPAYNSQQRGASNLFDEKLNAERKAGNFRQVPTESDLDAAEREAIDRLVDGYIPSLLGTLQIEGGAYRLTLNITYEGTNARLRRFRPVKRKTCSLRFTFPESFRADIEGQAKETLACRARFLLHGINRTLTFPIAFPSTSSEDI